MREYQAMKILADFRDKTGLIDLDAYLNSRGYFAHLSAPRDFFYDNDAADYCFIIYVFPDSTLRASVKGLDERHYREFRAKTRRLKVRLKYWPRELVDQAVQNFWDSDADYSLAESDAMHDVFRLPVGAVLHIVELVENHQS